MNRIQRKWLPSKQHAWKNHWLGMSHVVKVVYVFANSYIYIVTNLCAFNLFTLMSPNKRCEWCNLFGFERGVPAFFRVINKRNKRTVVRNIWCIHRISKIVYGFFFRESLSTNHNQRGWIKSEHVLTQLWFTCAQSSFNYRILLHSWNTHRYCDVDVMLNSVWFRFPATSNPTSYIWFAELWKN